MQYEASRELQQEPAPIMKLFTPLSNYTNPSPEVNKEKYGFNVMEDVEEEEEECAKGFAWSPIAEKCEGTSIL